MTHTPKSSISVGPDVISSKPCLSVVSPFTSITGSVGSSHPSATPTGMLGHGAAGLFGYETYISIFLWRQRHTTDFTADTLPTQHCPPFVSSLRISAFCRQLGFPVANKLAPQHTHYTASFGGVATFPFPPFGASSREPTPRAHSLVIPHEL